CATRPRELHLQLPAVLPMPDEAREAAHSSEAWLGRILNTAAADEAITTHSAGIQRAFRQVHLRVVNLIMSCKT
ncbi:MAG TPA: hypothetical protein VET48_13285, partial [Steroidobacteraceae bacterium]|nr:hypothetical protein [Steroidobacteraceae bacterium]